MKRFITLALVALLTFAIGVGCGTLWMMRRYSRAQRSKAGAPASAAIPSDTFITLERKGVLQAYTLAISSDGTVVFSASYFANVNGVNQLKRSGVLKSHITDDQVHQLITEFDRANYFSLRDRYRDTSDGCPHHATDLPTVYTSIQINGRKKSIEHDLGCLYDDGDLVTYPKELVAVETAIDQIVKTKQWMQ